MTEESAIRRESWKLPVVESSGLSDKGGLWPISGGIV